MKGRRGKQPQEVKDKAILGAKWATEHGYQCSRHLDTHRDVTRSHNEANFSPSLLALGTEDTMYVPHFQSAPYLHPTPLQCPRKRICEKLRALGKGSRIQAHDHFREREIDWTNSQPL